MKHDRQLLTSIAAHVDSRRDQTISFLGQLIDCQGGSEDREAVNRVGHLLAQRVTDLGFELQRHTPEVHGDHLVFKNHDGGGGHVVLAGHMDTTFTDYSELPAFHVDGEHAVGPGTADMRGGLVVLLCALECLEQLGALQRVPVTVIFNTDEERGSPSSHQLFSAEAAGARCAMVFECGGKQGEVVIGRRGKLSACLEVEGRAGHAADRELVKASAIEEMAHKVIAIEALNDARPGASFNVGKIRGGIAGNTFPRHARIDLDVRYLERQDQQWVEQSLQQITADNRAPGVRSSVRWTSARPMWEEDRRGEEQAALLGAITSAAEIMGVPCATEFRYGTSDANFLADAGVATVDGMGPVGFEDHTHTEHIILETLFERIQLTTLTLLQLYPA